MMQPANLRNRDDPATWRVFHASWLGTVVAAEMGLAQDQEVIEALAAKGADDPLDKGVLPGRARGDADLADSHPGCTMTRLDRQPIHQRDSQTQRSRSHPARRGRPIDRWRTRS
jgi:hypothetical protein